MEYSSLLGKRKAPKQKWCRIALGGIVFTDKLAVLVKSIKIQRHCYADLSMS